MRLVYMDEAGISKPKEEPFLVVAGAIIHADQSLNGIENYLERIMQRHVPARLREAFVFHATEVFNGGKTLKRQRDDFIGPREWPIERRLLIAEEILAIPKKFRLQIALGWVDRAQFPRTFNIPEEAPESEKTLAAHVCAFMNCTMMCEHWMRRNASDEVCMLVVENNDQAKKMISDVQRYHQNKKLVDILDEHDRKHFPLRKIKEDPLFQPKRQSHPLIVADFCAYVWKKILMADKRYDRFFELFRKSVVYFDDFADSAPAS